MWRLIVLIPSVALFLKCMDWARTLAKKLTDPADEADPKAVKHMAWLFVLCAGFYLIIAIMCIRGLWA